MPSSGPARRIDHLVVHKLSICRLPVPEPALVAEGLSNRAIATRLVVTERTVEAHIKQIFQKLGLSTDPDSHRRVLAVLAYLRSPA
jgi:DNA-binding CsgD family transcriptional regulator